MATHSTQVQTTTTGPALGALERFAQAKETQARKQQRRTRRTPEAPTTPEPEVVLLSGDQNDDPVGLVPQLEEEHVEIECQEEAREACYSEPCEEVVTREDVQNQLVDLFLDAQVAANRLKTHGDAYYQICDLLQGSGPVGDPPALLRSLLYTSEMRNDALNTVSDQYVQAWFALKNIANQGAHVVKRLLAESVEAKLAQAEKKAVIELENLNGELAENSF